MTERPDAIRHDDRTDRPDEVVPADLVVRDTGHSRPLALPALAPPVVEPVCGPPENKPPGHLYYRKEKLRGACWEYRIEGGWVRAPGANGDRDVLRHRFTFYRPREFEIPTRAGPVRMSRSGAEQWFFPDRWYSLLRFTDPADRTIGYYVNFSHPLREIKPGYYHDLDLELDLWLDTNGGATELDRPEFDMEVARQRIQRDWALCVEASYRYVVSAAQAVIAEQGPDLDIGRNAEGEHGLPAFILRA
ncbi:MAG TPA: DUF402 domain-containing protein [Thermomicrobiales bacterium]|nr:DUF402 domain-containing protein [Thermomicrobiales bacterium]